ncbi:MAG: DNA polymerase [Verrucomicrobiota bacterium]
MPLRYIFFDFDSFFASVEQQFRPELRGKPVGVVPSIGVDTTCCIAASYEAKARGVRTGTGVREARSLCPEIHFVEGNHRRYVQVATKIHQTIHQIVYIDKIASIDEMYGRLPPHWQRPQIAREKALEVKTVLRRELGPYIKVSIGIAPNRFIAKLASKMEKPNGLVLINSEDLPEALYGMELSDITGIGRNMLRRLRSARILSMQDLCVTGQRRLHQVWGSVEGDRMWYALQGYELPSPETKKQTISHSHVLPHQLRNHRAAHSVLHRMLHKACLRLRKDHYFAGQLDIYVKFGHELRWSTATSFFPTQDTVTMAHALNELWAEHPVDAPDPTKVSVVLSKLVPHAAHTPSLFDSDNQSRRVRLQQAMDIVNKKHGTRMIYHADAMEAQQSREAAPMRIAFTHIPDLEFEDDRIQCRENPK